MKPIRATSRTAQQAAAAQGHPVDPWPGDGLQVSGIVLRVLADVVAQDGIAPDTLFRNEFRGFATREPAEARLPLAVFLDVVRRAVALTGDPSLGLRCGLHASQSAFDLMAPLVSHVPTLRDGLLVAGRFQGLVLEGAQFRLTELSGMGRLRCEFPRLDAASERWFAEFMVAGLLRLLRAFGCDRGSLRAVHFEHGRPRRSAAYDAAFRGAERFSASFTGLEFDAALLDRPNLHANPSLQKLVSLQAEQTLGRLHRPGDFVWRLRVYLLGLPAGHVPVMQAAARALGVSVRSLRRRLSEEGHSFRGLVQELQSERACSLLRDPECTVQGVADALGFIDTNAFHRAFKRWTGQTPWEYRQALAAQIDECAAGE